jgi:hypothetical protein
MACGTGRGFWSSGWAFRDGKYGGYWMALFCYSAWIGIPGGQPKRFLHLAGMPSES